MTTLMLKSNHFYYTVKVVVFIGNSITLALAYGGINCMLLALAHGGILVD
jgi:hypothetical protein